jgi:hypothetical protein
MLPKFPAYVGWRRKTKIAGSASISHSKLSSNSICALDPIGFGIYLAEFHTISHPKSNVTRLPCDWRIAVKYGVELLARTDLSVTPPGTEPVTKPVVAPRFRSQRGSMCFWALKFTISETGRGRLSIAGVEPQTSLESSPNGSEEVKPESHLACNGHLIHVNPDPAI